MGELIYGNFEQRKNDTLYFSKADVLEFPYPLTAARHVIKAESITRDDLIQHAVEAILRHEQLESKSVEREGSVPADTLDAAHKAQIEFLALLTPEEQQIATAQALEEFFSEEAQ